MVRRNALFALTAFVAGTGCHAGLSGNAARQEPAIPRETVTVQRFVERHNQNAAAVKSLSAKPHIEVAGEGRRGRVDGRLDLERPRGFRLNLRGTGVGQVADLGSNDKEFWFWVKDNKDKAIYVCNYKDVNSSQLAETYQPDWIIEAMGLREIDAREASTIAATRPADKPGTLVLTQARKDNRGEMLTKETVVNEKDGHIIEHRLWAGAKKDLLARATVAQYKEYTLQGGGEDGADVKIQIPDKFRLEWVAEKFALDVSMAGVTVNPSYPQAQRTALFTEPQIDGTKKIDLAQLSGPAANTSTIRETRPSPRSGVRLGPPEPLKTEVEGTFQPTSEPPPTSADLSRTTARPSTKVIGAPVPRGLDPEALQASAYRQSWRPAALER